MSNKNGIPDSYFDEEQFLIDHIDEEKAVGILGTNPSPDQYFKYELCKLISQNILSQGYSNSEASKVIGIDASDVSRLLNFHIDRFTIDRLLKILCNLEGTKNIWKRISKISESMDKRMAG